MSELDRSRLIEAEWEAEDEKEAGELYVAELSVYAANRIGLVVDISRIFTERKIDIGMINMRTSKQGTVTLDLSFSVHTIDELNDLIRQIRQIDSVLDVERKTG